MQKDKIEVHVGRIVHIRTGNGEWEAVLKRRSPKNGHWEVKDPDGKIVTVTANQIVGVKEIKDEATDDGLGLCAVDSDKLPDESWELTELAQFVVAAMRRSSVSAWWIGKALEIARAKHRKSRDWLCWLKEDVEGLSKSTAYRYLDIYNTFSLEEVEGQPINALYKLMQIKDEPEELADDGQNTDEEGGTDADDTDPKDPVIIGKVGSGASATAEEQDTDGQPEDERALPDKPEMPVTDEEFDALAAFVEAVGGLSRAEYVFQNGIKQLRELKDEA